MVPLVVPLTMTVTPGRDSPSAAAVTLPLGITTSKEYAELEWPIDLAIAAGERVGLVGPNGVGKSTLLGALAGRVELDRGSVEVAPRTANVGLLPQEPDRSVTETVRSFLGRRSGVSAAQDELDAATAKAIVDKQFVEDMPIWEHKAHLVRPALADTDGPFMKFRKWYSQFYQTPEAALAIQQELNGVQHTEQMATPADANHNIDEGLPF